MRKISSLESKQGQLGGLGVTIIALVLASVILVFGLIVLQELRDTDVVEGGGVAANTTVWLAANSTVIGLATFADFWEIIVLAIVISVVIGLLLLVFGTSRSR